MKDKKIYTLLNVSSILNLITYILYILITKSLFSIFNIYITIFLLLSGIFYQNLLKKSVDEIREQKKILLLLAFFSIPVNIISSVLIFLVVDETDKIKGTNKLRGSPIIDKQNLLLNLGIGFVILSCILFMKQTYDIIPYHYKSLLIFIFGILFLILSFISNKIIKMKKTSDIFYLLSMCFIVLSYISIGLTNPFGLKDEFYYATGLMLISFLSYISNIKYTNKILKNISIITILLSLYYAIIYAEFFVGILLLIANISLLLLQKYDIKLPTYIFMFFSIFITQQIDVLSLIINTIVIIYGLLYLNKNCKSKNYNMITALILPFIVTECINIVNLTDEIKIVISASIIAILYCFLALIKYNEKNKIFNNTFQISTNILLCLLIIVGLKFTDYTSIYVALVSLLTNIIYLDINEKNNIIEKNTRPMKIILLLLSIYVSFKSLTIGEFMTFIYLISSLMYIISKDKLTKKIYFIVFILALTYQLFNYTLPILGLLAIIFAILLYLYNIKNKKFNVYSFLYMISALFIGLISTNLLNIGIIYSSIICIIIYVIISIIHKNNEKLKKIVDLALILPLFTLVNNFTLDSEIKQILLISLVLYTIYLIDKYLIKKESHNKVFDNIFISFVLFINIFNNSILVGLFIGTISILLILIGLYNNKYKHLINIGIIFTLLNIVYQIRNVLNVIPFSVYLLIVGLILICVVTYKKENEKK